jgi:hypothetical protein
MVPFPVTCKAVLDAHVLVALDDDPIISPYCGCMEIIWLVGAYADIAVKLVYTPALFKKRESEAFPCNNRERRTKPSETLIAGAPGLYCSKSWSDFPLARLMRRMTFRAASSPYITAVNIIHTERLTE